MFFFYTNVFIFAFLFQLSCKSIALFPVDHYCPLVAETRSTRQAAVWTQINTDVIHIISYKSILNVSSVSSVLCPLMCPLMCPLCPLCPVSSDVWLRPPAGHHVRHGTPGLLPGVHGAVWRSPSGLLLPRPRAAEALSRGGRGQPGPAPPAVLRSGGHAHLHRKYSCLTLLSHPPVSPSCLTLWRRPPGGVGRGLWGWIETETEIEIETELEIETEIEIELEIETEIEIGSIEKQVNVGSCGLWSSIERFQCGPDQYWKDQYWKDYIGSIRWIQGIL